MRSASSADGLGGGGGAASSFLWRRFSSLTMQNTTNAIIRKLSTALRKHEVAAAGQGDGQASQGLIVPGEDAEHRVEDVVYQGVGDSLERAADDDADGQIHHIAPGNEFAEFGQKAGGFLFSRHKNSLFKR